MYAGESKAEGLVRKGQVISCTDPRIDQMICMSYEDVEKLINSCEYWK